MSISHRDIQGISLSVLEMITNQHITDRNDLFLHTHAGNQTHPIPSSSDSIEVSRERVTTSEDISYLITYTLHRHSSVRTPLQLRLAPKEGSAHITLVSEYSFEGYSSNQFDDQGNRIQTKDIQLSDNFKPIINELRYLAGKEDIFVMLTKLVTGKYFGRSKRT